MPYKYFCGIDVGKSGGVSVVNEDGIVVMSEKIPDSVDDKLSLMRDITDKFGVDTSIIMIESVHGRLGDSMGSVNTFMFDFGAMTTAAASTGIKCIIVSPKQWMAYYRCVGVTKSYTLRKKLLKSLAENLEGANDIRVTLWNADSILISNFCRRKYKNK